MTDTPNPQAPGSQKSETPDLAVLLAGAGKKKSSRWGWRLLILCLVALAAGGYVYVFGNTGDKPVYTTQPMKRGDLTVLVTATGSVEPTEKVDISSELSGTVRAVNVDYNSIVKKGDVLATLDTIKLEADLQSARAKLNSAKANVLKAEADLGSARSSLDRLTSLVQNRVSTQQELDAAQFKYDAALATKQINEADVLGAEADLQLAEVNLQKSKIISPINGVVLSRAVDPGATVAASLSAPVLFTIAGDLKQMELQVDVDEADVGQVDVGQKATFRVDAFPDMSFPADIRTIRFVSETVSNVVTYMAVLSVENDKLLLRPGMTATADIVVNAIHDTLMVPNAALRYSPPQARASRGGGGMFGLFRPPRMGAITAVEPSGAKRTVWALRNGIATSVAVEIGASDGQFTQLLSGDLTEKDSLVTDSSTASN